MDDDSRRREASCSAGARLSDATLERAADGSDRPIKEAEGVRPLSSTVEEKLNRRRNGLPPTDTCLTRSRIVGGPPSACIAPSGDEVALPANSARLWKIFARRRATPNLRSRLVPLASPLQCSALAGGSARHPANRIASGTGMTGRLLADLALDGVPDQGGDVGSAERLRSAGCRSAR